MAQNRAEVTFFNPNTTGICCFCLLWLFLLTQHHEKLVRKSIGAVAIGINLFGLSFRKTDAFRVSAERLFTSSTIRNSTFGSASPHCGGLMFLFSNGIGVRVKTDGRTRFIWNAGMVLFKQNPWRWRASDPAIVSQDRRSPSRTCTQFICRYHFRSWDYRNF